MHKLEKYKQQTPYQGNQCPCHYQEAYPRNSSALIAQECVVGSIFPENMNTRS